MQFRPIHCPYCGLELQVPTDAKQIVCMYCAKPIDLEALLSPAVNEPNSGLRLQKALALLDPRLYHFELEEKSFNAQKYAGAFSAYYSRLSPSLAALSGLAPEDCRGFAQSLMDSVADDFESEGSARIKSAAFFTRRMMVVAYLLPALRESKVPESGAVLAEFIRLWNARYPQEPVSASTFTEIDSGFRRKGCYITTAVCTALGQGDDCPALQALRGFRDGWMARHPSGAVLTQEYYALAPAIVQAIARQPDSQAVYRALWRDSIAPCVRHIRARRYTACLTRYVQMMLQLERTYLS